MNTRVFQRLRRIRQLAMAHLVYPGALHTRFEHSVGTMHVAGRICERLSEFKYINQQDTKAVRLAALLHDIGHGPFSHVSEFLLDRDYDRDKIQALPDRERIH
ncbi:MAG: HD domain-containing protein, partial [Chloroflexota bacterium]|nr:HD domain-containing protein [Chloroflexota bacterium]